MITTTSTSTATWLTARRLRTHGVILALCVWTFYAWNMATPGLRDRNGNLKGTDFLHFYTLGSVADAHRGADLYDIRAQEFLAEQRVPEAAGIRYLPLYPPQVSMFFAPLARMSYGWALFCWWVCSTILYGTCCYGVWRACPGLREYGGTVVILAVAFPAFFHLIAWGQTSAMALACFTLMFFLLRDRREFLAGLVFGCLIFKPQLGVAGAILFLSTAAWKTLAGIAISAAAQLFAGVLYYGIGPLREWGRTMWNVQTVLPMLEPKPYQTHSLRTFWAMLVPRPAFSLMLYVVSAVVVLGLTIACWKRTAVPMPLKYAVLLLASVLVAPHLTVYDLVILAPALILLADWLVAQPSTPSTRGLGALLYLVFMLPLLGPFARWTHLQPSVVALALSVYLIWKISTSVASAERR